jgi:hypothetical protein
MFDKAQERESIRQTVAAFERVLKQPFLGYISPGHRPTDKTAEILAEAGYIWDADFQERDTARVTEIAGRQMVVMPHTHMSDYMTYPLNGRTPREVLQLLVGEFNVLYAEGVAGRPKMMG